MSTYSIDINQVADDTLEQELVASKEELAVAREGYLKVKAKVDAGEEMTLEDQRLVILWNRADRTTKFILNKTTKKVKVVTGKKLSRVALVELLELAESGQVLSEYDSLSVAKSLLVYKGKKLAKKALHELMMKEVKLHLESKRLNEVDYMDKVKSIFGEVTSETMELESQLQ